MTSHSDPVWVCALNNRLPDGSEYNFGPWITAERANMEDGTPGAIFIPAQSKGSRDIIAAPAPIAITGKYRNLQRGTESVEVSWGDSLQHSVIVDRELTANSSKVVRLASFGAPIDSNHARNIVSFFSDVQHLNSEVLPTRESTGKLGWVKSGAHGETFVPYADIAFDRTNDFGAQAIFNAVKSHGSFSEWIELSSAARKKSPVVRIVLAAALASALLGKCNGQPFIVYTWGMSGLGKTVLLSLAASIWANPSTSGGFLKTADTTINALCATNGILNSLPLCCDELQTIKRQQKFLGYDEMIMRLCEGIGRGRLNADGTSQYTDTWQNVSLLNGEEPVISSTSGNGVVNRTIEIHITNELFVGSEGGKVVRTITQNYGHAGKEFTDFVKTQESESLVNFVASLTDEVQQQTDATGKQAVNAAFLLLADHLARECIWTNADDPELTIDDLAPFLATSKTVDKSEAAFQYALSVISAHTSFFIDVHGARQNSSELWGKLVGDERSGEVREVYIIRSILERELKANDFTLDAYLEDWERKGYITASTEKNKKRFSPQIRIAGGRPPCIHIILSKTQQ